MRFADLLQKQPDCFLALLFSRGLGVGAVVGWVVDLSVWFSNAECKIGKFETAVSQMKQHCVKLNCTAFL